MKTILVSLIVNSLLFSTGSSLVHVEDYKRPSNELKPQVSNVETPTNNPIELDENALTINKTSYQLTEGQNETIAYKVNYEGEYKLTFTSKDESIATVSNKGIITAVKAGSTQVVLVLEANGKTIEKTVDVTVTAAKGSVVFADQEVYIVRGSETTLNYTLSNSSLSESNIIWNSSKPSVATVENGKIKGLSIGETTISATITGNKTTVKVIVTVPLREIKFNPEEIEVSVGEKIEIPELIYVPYDTSSKIKPTLVVEDPTVLGIEDQELVGLKLGTTTVKANIGRIVTELKVNVIPKKTETGASVIPLEVEQTNENQLVLSAKEYDYKKGKKYAFEFPKEAIQEFVSENKESEIVIVIEEALLKENMNGIDSITLTQDTLEGIEYDSLTLRLINSANRPQVGFVIKEPLKSDLNLKYSLTEIKDSSKIYPKVGGKSYRLQFQPIKQEIGVIVDVELLESNLSTMHFLYKYDEKENELIDTNQEIVTDSSNSLSFNVDSNDYIITFSRISRTNDKSLIIGLLVTIIAMGGISTFIYIKRSRKKNNL